MDQLTNIAERLRKISHKKYEYYVISRIIHRLDDLEIQFVTQQVVVSEGKRYLIDLYFPQFKLAVEVDEDFHKKQVADDKRREAEIISELGVEFVRIPCSYPETIQTVNLRIEALIDRLRELKRQDDFQAYDYDTEYSTAQWIRQGYIEVGQPVKFRTHADTLELFGKHYKDWFRGTCKLDEKTMVWFPKLYPNGRFDNRLIENGKTIVMKDTVEDIQPIDLPERVITFAHQKDELGALYYHFKGVFTCVHQDKDEIRFERLEDGERVDLKPYLEK